PFRKQKRLAQSQLRQQSEAADMATTAGRRRSASRARDPHRARRATRSPNRDRSGVGDNGRLLDSASIVSSGLSPARSGSSPTLNTPVFFVLQGLRETLTVSFITTASRIKSS